MRICITFALRLHHKGDWEGRFPHVTPCDVSRPQQRRGNAAQWGKFPSETSDYRVCQVMAEERGTTAQRVYYHVKKLGLAKKCVAADKVEERGQ